MDRWANGTTCPLAGEFLELAKGGFPNEPLQRVESIGDLLVRESGDVRLAARKVHETQMRRMEPQAQSTRELLQGHPQLRIEIVQLQTIGAIPHFRGSEPEAPRPPGLPYDSQKTRDTVGGIWKDAKEGARW